MSAIGGNICKSGTLCTHMPASPFHRVARRRLFIANGLFLSLNKPEERTHSKSTSLYPLSFLNFRNYAEPASQLVTAPKDVQPICTPDIQAPRFSETQFKSSEPVPHSAFPKFWLKGTECADEKGARQLPLWSAKEECSSVGAQISLQARLQRMRECLSLDAPSRRQQEVLMIGTGRHLGVDVAWSLRWRPDGAFVEELTAQHMRYKWGHSGVPGTSAWEVDSAGISKQLNYDDHESILLAAWIRTGCWLYPEAASQLEMQMVPNEELPDERTKESSCSDSGEPGCSGRGLKTAENQFTVAIRLKSGKMVAKVAVCSLDYRPLSLRQPLCGDVEYWNFEDWKEWQPMLLCPSSIHHRACAGGHHEYYTQSCSLLPLTGPALLFQMPSTPLLPLDADFDDSVSPVVEAWKTKSGHLVVQVQLNGESTRGYVILDTGASGFVIESSAAEEMKLEQFGELYVAGIGGKVRSKFRKASSLTIGPLTIRDPVFMEMNLGGLVRCAPGPVVGIVGYDVFRRSIIEIPQGVQDPPTGVDTTDGTVTLTTAAHRKGSASRAGPHVASVQGVKRDSSRQQCHLLLHNPAKYSQEEEGRWGWYPMEMIANLPHLSVTFECASGEQHEALFMLDSGAGGADLMFHSRAVQELGLLSKEPGNRSVKLLKGVGGEKVNSMRVHSMELPWLRLYRLRFDNVRCLFAGAGGLDISLYSSGLFCADLMMRSTVVLDYARQRIGFLKASTESASPLEEAVRAAVATEAH